jgi:hypothetical protein
LTLDAVQPGNVAAHAETWEKVVRKLRAGMMPPAGRPRPTKPALEAWVSQVETALDANAKANPNPGRTETFHRLNRAEYQNAVRDLLGLDIDVADMLPADDGSYGFDNIAGVLRVSPALMERYIAAARRVSRLALGVPPRSPVAETYRVSPEMLQYDHVDGLPFGTRGGMLIQHTFPADGEYDIQLTLGRAVWEQYPIQGLSDERHELEVTIDGNRVGLFPVTRPAARGAPGYETASRDPEAGLRARVAVTAGPHDVTAAFLKKTSALIEEDLRQPFQKPYLNQVYRPQVGSVTITGPLNPRPRPQEDTPSRKRVLVCHPANPSEELSCARTIATTLARRAYRRPVTDADVVPLLDFYKQGAGDGGFETGIEMVIRRLLLSVEFLFRIERDPTATTDSSGDAPEPAGPTTYRIGGIELASRLSFFLWSSIPDDELIEAGASGRLSDARVLEQQVRRMLRDPRAEALVTNFAGQWLYLRNLAASRPDEVLFPDFDEDLRIALRRETELFFGGIIREDRSVLELIKADYTYLNERLARHYGIPHIYGSHFRRVTLSADTVRGGLLGQGSVLTVTSHANRTSPVQRGKWLLENILGSPPPPPLPNVPPLDDARQKNKAASVRELMEQHRANPTCASCHKVMDPLGFALEHFDAVGRWRTRDGATPIDASAELPDGSTFTGVNGLRAALLERSNLFVTTLTEKLMIYALGRGLEYYDAPTVRAIVRDAARRDHRFTALVLGIVNGTPFQMRRVSQ